MLGGPLIHFFCKEFSLTALFGCVMSWSHAVTFSWLYWPFTETKISKSLGCYTTCTTIYVPIFLFFLKRQVLISQASIKHVSVSFCCKYRLKTQFFCLLPIKLYNVLASVGRQMCKPLQSKSYWWTCTNIGIHISGKIPSLSISFFKVLH